MDFEHLMKIANKMNKIEGEKCLICHFPDNNKNLLKLDCNHFYHKNCLFNSSKIRSTVTCSYCNKKTLFSKAKKLSLLNKKPCKKIIKSGINKGKICNRLNCKYHKNHLQSELIITQDVNTNDPNSKEKDKIVINKIGCQSIIKSGKRKGEICKRLNCIYHKNSKVFTLTSQKDVSSPGSISVNLENKIKEQHNNKKDIII